MVEGLETDIDSIADKGHRICRHCVRAGFWLAQRHFARLYLANLETMAAADGFAKPTDSDRTTVAQMALDIERHLQQTLGLGNVTAGRPKPS